MKVFALLWLVVVSTVFGHLECPTDSQQVGVLGADIGGCGLESCDDRYDKSIEQCEGHCNSITNCKGYNWAPLDADPNHPDKKICTVYSSDQPTSIYGDKQIFCKLNPLVCPSGSVKVGELGADIGGCGLQSCDARYGKVSIEQCEGYCNSRTDCKGYSWTRRGCDPNHPDKKVCTVYNNDAPTSTYGGKQIFCKPNDLGIDPDYCVNDADCDFNCNWQCYLDRNPDLQNTYGPYNVIAAEAHYYISGINEGRDCRCTEEHPLMEHCNWQCYLDRYPALQSAYGPYNTIAAAAHYDLVGRAQGDDCECHPCDWQCYLDRYPDLRAAYGPYNTIAAAAHYNMWGKSEGRKCDCDCSTQLYDTSDSGMQSYATKYAPLLRFDRAAASYGYPMNAQHYLETEEENHVLDHVHNPTYWRAYVCCGDNSKTLKIVYWWWYGHQHQCGWDKGDHEGDWERIVVHVRYDLVQKVTYYQHSGHYTADASEIYFDGNHPIVYVGKVGHGSYYDPNGFSGGCGYFYDYRDPEDVDDYLRSWEKLIALDLEEEDWMEDPDASNLVVTCCSNPLKLDAPNICGADGCDDAGCHWKDCDSTDELMLNPTDCVKAKAIPINPDLSTNGMEETPLFSVFMVGLVAMLLFINLLMIVYMKCFKKRKVYQAVKMADSCDSEEMEQLKSIVQ